MNKDTWKIKCNSDCCPNHYRRDIRVAGSIHSLIEYDGLYCNTLPNRKCNINECPNRIGE